jgi:hypothetical protein
MDWSLLEKLKNAFPEWNWYGKGAGFITEVSIPDAIFRIETLLDYNTHNDFVFESHLPTSTLNNSSSMSLLVITFLS